MACQKFDRHPFYTDLQTSIFLDFDECCYFAFLYTLICCMFFYCQLSGLASLFLLLGSGVIMQNLPFLYFSQGIVGGLTYLHNSEIESHGRLKSTNILIDNRWTAKLTGSHFIYFIPGFLGEHWNHLTFFGNYNLCSFIFCFTKTILFWEQRGFLLKCNILVRTISVCFIFDRYTFKGMLKENSCPHDPFHPYKF